MKLVLVAFLLCCFQSISQVAGPPNVELPEVEPPKSPEHYIIEGIGDAKFPGGIAAMKYYFQSFGDSIPENWADSSYNKRGYVVFIVETDSTLSNIEVFRSIGKEADLFMIKLIENMPKWCPACDRHGSVRSRVRLPITFDRPE